MLHNNNRGASCSIVMLITPFHLVCSDKNNMDSVKALLLLDCNIATNKKLCLYIADCN